MLGDRLRTMSDRHGARVEVYGHLDRQLPGNGGTGSADTRSSLMTVKAFLHVKIDVEDLERSLDFYCGKLLLQQIVRYDLPLGTVIVQVSPTGQPPGIELWYEKPFKGFDNDRLHVAFEVEDVERTVRELRERGVWIEQETFRKGHELIAFLRDPDGYLIELNEDASRTKRVHENRSK